MKIRIYLPLLSLFILFSAADTMAQKKKFFSVCNVKCKEVYAYYYRIMVKTGSLYKVTEYYTENNQLKFSGQYTSKKMEFSHRDGDFVWYYSNGQKILEGSYANGKATGKWTAWYKDGQVKNEGEYEKSNKEGQWSYYHRNGKLRSQPTYKDGDIDGLYVGWYDNGEKRAELNYTKGKLHGDFTFYYLGNLVKSKGSYEKDSLDGTYERFWKNGKTSYKGEYRDNKRTGVWEFFHSNGNKSCEVEYSSKGKFVKGAFFDEDGKKLSKKVMADDLTKDAEYPGGKSDMYKEINEKLNKKLDFRGAKAEKYVILVKCVLTIDEEGNITKRTWEYPDEDDDEFEDKYDVVKFVNSAIDDFPKFKPGKYYNRNYEDEVSIIYYIEFAKIK